MFESVVVPNRPEIDVVDEDDVDLVHAQAEPGLFERAQHAAIAVVESGREVQAARAHAGQVGGRGDRGHPAADLGGDHQVVAGLVAQGRAEAEFGAAVAVIGRRVEKAQSGIIGRSDGGDGLGFGDAGAEAAEGGGAEAELGDGEGRFAELAAGERVHVVNL